MKYQIHAIADENCSSIHASILAEADELHEAKELASQHSASAYGSAILDTETSEIDFGFGFGVLDHTAPVDPDVLLTLLKDGAKV